MAQKTSPNKDVEQFLTQLHRLGGTAGNRTLRTILQWDEDRYWATRDYLLRKSEITLGRGQGGSVRRIPPAQPPSSAINKESAEAATVQTNAQDLTDAPDDEDVEVEGFDSEPQVDAIEAYPLDSIHVRQEPRTIVDVLRRIDKGFFKLDPDFQRDFLWDEQKQSRLIESVLMRIPLPVFYVAEEENDGSLVVVDGLQRLTTLHRFFNNKLVLDLKDSELHGKTYDGLAGKLRNRFEDGMLVFYIIDAKAPERVRLDIFERVNSGVPITKQQMRNALYSGPATRLLRELASSEIFVETTGWAVSGEDDRREQRDREVINRFMAFHVHGWRAYPDGRKADMAEFLGSALRKVNRMGDADRNTISGGFHRSMKINQRVFGHHAFRKHHNEQDRRHPFNVALFEVMSVLLLPYTENYLSPNSEQALRERFYGLMGDPKFLRSISAGTTASDSVRTRFGHTEFMIRKVLGDP